MDLVGKEFPEAFISVDTFRSTVAKEAVAHGAAVVNDISAGSIDEKMFEVVGSLHYRFLTTRREVLGFLGFSLRGSNFQGNGPTLASTY